MAVYVGSIDMNKVETSLFERLPFVLRQFILTKDQHIKRPVGVEFEKLRNIKNNIQASFGYYQNVKILV